MRKKKLVLRNTMVLVLATTWFSAGLLAGEKENQPSPKLIPKPQIFHQGAGRIQLSETWKIISEQDTPETRFALRWLREGVSKKISLNLQGGEKATGRIILSNAGIDNPQQFFRTRKIPSGVLQKIRTQGYLLEITPGKNPTIKILADTDTGVFYGVNTLLQLLNAKGEVAAATVLDWPDHQWRGIMARSFTPQPNLQKRRKKIESNLVFTQANKDKIDQLAHQKINILWCFEYAIGNPWSHFYQKESYWKKAYQGLFQYARQRHMEVVPLIGSPRNWNSIPSELLEGWWIKNEPFTFGADDVAHADLPSNELIKNGNFEAATEGENIPDGWQVINAKGRFRIIKDLSGKNKTKQAQLTMPPETSLAKLSSEKYHGRPILRYDIDLRGLPVGSIYFLSAKIRGKFTTPKQGTKAWVQVQILSEQGKSLGNSYFGLRRNTKGWRNFGKVVRVDKTNAKIRLQFFLWKGIAGKLWVDNVQCVRVNGLLRNVLRGKDTDIVVRSADGKTTYQEGKDYTISNGDFPQLSAAVSLGEYRRAYTAVPAFATKPFVVKRLNTGSITQQQTVQLSYDILLSGGAKGNPNQPPCVSEKRYYTEYIFPAIDRVIKNFHPLFIHFGADEINGMNRDSRCRKRHKTNAELLAEWANTVSAYLKKTAPECHMYMWQDMLSPYFNGGNPNYQCGGGGAVGRTAETTEKNLLDNSIRIGIWHYQNTALSQMNAEPTYFAQKGFKYFSAAWREKDNLTAWSQLMNGRPNALGCLDMTWEGNANSPALHRHAADRFWNSRGKVIYFDGFDKGKPGDTTPPGWTASGEVVYSTDGTQQQGRNGKTREFFKGAVLLRGESTLTSVLRPAIAQARYKLTAYIKRDDSSKQTGFPSLAITWFDKNQKPLGTAKEPSSALTTKYSVQHLRASAPKDTAFLSIQLVGAGKSRASFWFDTIFLVEDTFK